MHSYYNKNKHNTQSINDELCCAYIVPKCARKNKKEYAKHEGENNLYLKEHVIQINGFLRYAKNHPALYKELEILQEQMDNVVATSDTAAVERQENINRLFLQLEELFKEDEWEESKALKLVNDIGYEMDMMNSLRSNY